jgi:hypothetical protein
VARVPYLGDPREELGSLVNATPRRARRLCRRPDTSPVRDTLAGAVPVTTDLEVLD